MENLYVTYLRYKGDGHFTIILHDGTQPLNNMPSLTEASQKLIARYGEDIGKEDFFSNWYIYTEKVNKDMLPFSPVTWLDGETQIIGDQI